MHDTLTPERRRRVLVSTYFGTLVTALLCCAVSSAMAHGTAGVAVERRTVCVLFTYDDGEPMSYGKVTVTAPESELPFQSGATDRNGIACFAPDRLGRWQISSNDGMGHLQKLSIPVAEEDARAVALSVPSENSSGGERTSRIIAGVGAILGVAGLIGLYQSSRRKSLIESKHRP